ncbi:MAG: hypothetical protein K2I44_01110 [Muribaculaceae bacterium]|nr:hypothetical protein [Muribaculaceae bacterium]
MIDNIIMHLWSNCKPIVVCMQRIISDSYVGSVVISGYVESRTVEIFVIEKASRTPEFPRTYSDFSSRERRCGR